MGKIASQITSLAIVYWTVYSGADKKKTSKLRLCGDPGSGEFPAQMACNVENVSILWRHHVIFVFDYFANGGWRQYWTSS